MSNPWGKIGPGIGSGIGSWAAEAEREEAEERENTTTAATTITTTTTTTNPKLFPSLKESITTKPKKKKMTLSEFVSSGSTGLTPDEMLKLPTAPKPRDPNDVGPRLGGGFSSYGDNNDRRPKRRDFDNNRNDNMMMNMPPPPSRADEVDNWALSKKPISVMDSSRSSSSRYGQLGGGSRADEVDNWNFGKKSQVGFQGGVGAGARSSGFGSGFRDSGSDWRRGGGEMGNDGGERPRLVLDPPKGRNGVEGNEDGMKTTGSKANPFGVARPREEVLAEKGLDWKKLDLEIEAKKGLGSSSGSRPASSQGSRPTSSQSNRGGVESVGGGGNVEVKPRPKVNPFGDAKPREVLLEEKGLDWRKIDLDLEHRRIDRPETEEETALKEEIENLRKELEKSGNGVSQEGEVASLHDLIQSKEKELEALTRDLDDKVRFGQKAVEKPNSRPGSGAGRYTSYPERPPSQSGTSFDDVRGPEIMDRPRSRGTGDVWTRPGEDRRGGFKSGRDRGGGYQGSRDRGGFQGRGGYQGRGDRGGYQGGRGGFLGNREFDRSSSGERW